MGYTTSSKQSFSVGKVAMTAGEKETAAMRNIFPQKEALAGI
jgi:hypothetical protein